MQNLIFTQQMQLATHHIYGNARLGIKHTDTTLYMRNITINGFDTLGNVLVNDVLDSVQLQIDTAHYQHALATKQYELTNHLGNVLATVLDRKTQNQADIVSAQHYYPYHSVMQTWEADGKEYAFGGANGQEKDKEIRPDLYGALYWEYDSRLGGNGRWNVDPKPHPGISPYATYAGNPVWFSDPLGDSIKIQAEWYQFMYKNRVNRDLGKMAQTNEGKKILDDLQKSTDVYTIKKGKAGDNHFVPGEHGGGEIFYNPSDGWAFLGHEADHAYQFEHGNLNNLLNTPWATPDKNYTINFQSGNSVNRQLSDLNESEAHAMDAENKMRAEAGIKLRSYYGITIDNDASPSLIHPGASFIRETVVRNAWQVISGGKGTHPNYPTNYKTIPSMKNFDNKRRSNVMRGKKYVTN